jgi:type I restriction enzyme M protein
MARFFFQSRNEISDSAKLHKLVQMIDEESCVMLDTDVKGDIYEGFLQ